MTGCFAMHTPFRRARLCGTFSNSRWLQKPHSFHPRFSLSTRTPLACTGAVRSVRADEKGSQPDRSHAAEHDCQAFLSEVQGRVLSGRVALEQGVAVPDKEWYHEGRVDVVGPEKSSEVKIVQPRWSWTPD